MKQETEFLSSIVNPIVLENLKKNFIEEKLKDCEEIRRFNELVELSYSRIGLDISDISDTFPKYYPFYRDTLGEFINVCITSTERYPKTINPWVFYLENKEKEELKSLLGSYCQKKSNLYNYLNDYKKTIITSEDLKNNYPDLFDYWMEHYKRTKIVTIQEEILSLRKNIGLGLLKP